MLKKILLLGLVAALTACGGDKEDPIPLDVPTVIPDDIPAPPVPMVNAVTNGDFENATAGDTGTGGEVIAGWNLLLGGTADATYTVVDDPVNGGSNALEVAVTTPGANAWEPQATSNFTVPVGTHTISVWVDGTPGAMVKVVVQLPVDPWSGMGEMEGTLDDTEGEFQEITFEITSETEQELQIGLQAGLAGNEGATIVWDDVTVMVPEQSDIPANYIPNGGFELDTVGESGTGEGNPAQQWNAQLGGTAAALYTIVATPVMEGVNALEMNITTVGTNPWEPQATSTFELPAGDYTASVWVDGDEGAEVTFAVQLPDDGYGDLGRQTLTLDGSEGFQQLIFDITQETTQRVQVGLLGGAPGNNGAMIYWDGATIAVNFVANGGFESDTIGATGTGEGIADNWNLQVGGDAEASYEIVGDPVHRGANALEMTVTTVGANPWEPQATHTFELNAGTYTASAWVNGTPGAEITFAVQLPDDGYGDLGRQTLTLDNDEDTYEEITFEIIQADPQRVQLGILGGAAGNGSVVYVDEVSIFKVETEETEE